VGQKSERLIDARFTSAAGSPRHLLLPMAVISALDALVLGLPDVPDAVRIELLNAKAAVRRAYRLPDKASAIELAWEFSDEEIPTDVSP